MRGRHRPLTKDGFPLLERISIKRLVIERVNPVDPVEGQAGAG
jgi:hypothetical protein